MTDDPETTGVAPQRGLPPIPPVPPEQPARSAVPEPSSSVTVAVPAAPVPPAPVAYGGLPPVSPGTALPPVPPAPAGDQLPPVTRRPADLLPPPQPVEGPQPDRSQARHARRRRTALTALLALAAIVLAVAGVGWWTFLRHSGPDVPAGKLVTVVIPQGADVLTIGSKLAAAGVINNENMFQLSVRSSGQADRFHAGTYQLSTGMPDDAVIDELVAGPQAQGAIVTIPEGYTVRQVARRLHDKAGVSAAEFTDLALNHAGEFKSAYPFLRENPTDSLEGYLFPKTYAIRRGMSSRQIIELMLDQFGKETAGLDLGYARSKNLTLHDVVTIASIVSKESRLPKDGPVVASVVYNRLKNRIRLRLDTTVIYALGLESKSKVYFKDLAVNSPYNTYKHDGLPPGPICNPGLAALQAAAHPVTSTYIYFVATGKDGSLTFATTDAEFQRAKERMVR